MALAEVPVRGSLAAHMGEYRGFAVLAAVLAALALAVPAVANATSHPSVPNCQKFTTKKLKSLIAGDQKLHFEYRFATINTCAFLGHRQTNHYEMAVNIFVLSGTKSLWHKEVTAAKKAAAEQGATYKVVSYSSPEIVKYGQIQSGAGLGPCSGNQVPVTRPPSCDTEPDWWHQNAWGYGTLQGTKTTVVVGAEVYAELDDASTNAAVDLVHAVLARKIK